MLSSPQFSNVMRTTLTGLLKHTGILFQNGRRTFVKESHESVKEAGSNTMLPMPCYGQPIASTHPHLIHGKEVMPGLELDEFKERRAKFLTNIQKVYAEKFPNYGRNKRAHLIIIPSATRKYMSGKIPYVFRQNSDFLYLTGCMEPDTVLALSIDVKDNMKSMLFMQPRDRHAEQWEGPRTGVDVATRLFGIDEAHLIENLQNVISQHAKTENPQFWYDVKDTTSHELTRTLIQTAQSLRTPSAMQSPLLVLQQMKLYKSLAEQTLMKQTCQIASAAINDVIRDAKPGDSEHHIYAMVDYRCRMRNATHLAYPPVVASGRNATIIHYINNNQLVQRGDMVLMDAGCEYSGYCSDITRTWPISGEFTEPQKVLYEVTLRLQKDLIEMLMKEGGRSLDELFDSACIRLAKYMREVGLVPSHIDDVINLTRAGYRFCPHHVSHFLGMDVHDSPLVSRSIPLQPGMVFTVEPGIYISPDRHDVPEEFRGIGVRIEDDILIDKDNNIEVLTSSCVKNVKDLQMKI